MVTANDPPIGQFIKQQTLRLGRSYRSVALEIGFSPAHFNDIINGRKQPGVETVNRIADYFQVPRSHLHQLMGWTNEPQGNQAVEADLTFLRELVEIDQGFMELARVYANLPLEERKRVVRLVSAFK